MARKGGQQCEVFWDARDYLFEIRRSAQGELKLDAVYPDATSADIIGFTEARLTEWFDSINEKISTKQEGGPGACFPFVSRRITKSYSIPLCEPTMSCQTWGNRSWAVRASANG